jgi:NAD(P)H-nitrite reductase large subunit
MLYLNESAEALQSEQDGLIVRLKSGRSLKGELVILGIGVRPESRLAVQAGLDVGPRRGIRVTEHMRTADAHIYAVGDAVEVRDIDRTQTTSLNRQSRSWIVSLAQGRRTERTD